MRRFRTKDAARRAVWDALEREGQARFPYPPHGRIPNFAGAEEAARRLAELPAFRRARRIKVNPDAPQLPVRRLALEMGIAVYVPTPRLRAGFLRLDPKRIPRTKAAEAASLSRGRRWARPVPVARLPAMDLVVVGSVAVTPTGHRCGKGHGYGDLEYALLRELGHPPPLVATTVHPLQLVRSLPAEPHDLPVAWIVTPEAAIRVARPPRPPGGIAWRLLTEEDLSAMPVLGELRRRAGSARPARR